MLKTFTGSSTSINDEHACWRSRIGPPQIGTGDGRLIGRLGVVSYVLLLLLLLLELIATITAVVVASDGRIVTDGSGIL